MGADAIGADAIPSQSETLAGAGGTTTAIVTAPETGVDAIGVAAMPSQSAMID
jgi:hypothetical protein